VSPAPGSGVFGAGSSGKTSPFSGFGSSSGSIGNPVGFGFGVSPKAGEVSPPSSGALGFSFGAAPPKTESMPSGEQSRGETPMTEGSEEDGAARLLSPGIHDQEGEGEEDEETTHAVKSKVYKMIKGKETKWGDMGVGILRLKKHKITGARRVFLRNSSTGKIIINFRIYVGLQPTVSERTISFIGHGEDGTSIPFKLRVGKEESAVELKDALDREVSLVEADKD